MIIPVASLIRLVAMLGLFVFSLGPAAATGENAIALTGATLIDGTGAASVPNGAIVLRGDRIESVGTQDHVIIPADAMVIPLSGQTIIPGFVDLHLHVGQCKGIDNGSVFYNAPNIQRQLIALERAGTTTAVALGLNRDLFYQIRALQHSGRSNGADLFGADRGIGAPEGVPPASMKVDPEALYRPDTPEAARVAVREAADRKTDLIKVWFDDWFHTLPRMKSNILSAVTDEAHHHGLRVAAHIFYLADAKEALRAGVDIIAHSVRDTEVDEEFIHLARTCHAIYIPTLELDESTYVYTENAPWMAEPLFRQVVDPVLLQKLQDPVFIARLKRNPNLNDYRQAHRLAMVNVKRVFEAGVPVGFGTDAGATPLRVPGFAEQRELQLLVASGLTPLQAIQCATQKSAESLLLNDRGTLQSGKLADFIVLSANPVEKIENVAKITAVWHRGRLSQPAIDE